MSLSSWCIASLYLYHFSTVIDFWSEKYSGSTGHTGTPGASREIYREDADDDAIHELDKLNSFPAIAFELYNSMARAPGL